LNINIRSRKTELLLNKNLQEYNLLYRQECFSGKLTTRKVHTKLHPGLEWLPFHILTSEDIDDVISCFYTVVCAKTLLSI